MSPLPAYPCYLNGEFLPLAEARISVLDRGFLFGDGVYEVVPVYGGRLFRAEDHLKRLARSLAQAHLPNPHDEATWLALMAQTVEFCAKHTDAQEQLLYLQVTRGVAPERHLVIPPEGVPTVFMMANPHQPPSAATRHHGIKAVTAHDFRWERGTLKTTSMLGNVLARQMATEQDAAETLMIHDGHLTEGASSNVWVVLEDALVTPPPGDHVLPGVRLTAAARAVRGGGHRLQPAAGVGGRIEHGHRSDHQFGRARDPARHHARRPAGGPWRRPGQARAGVCAAVRGLPAGQAGPESAARGRHNPAMPIPPEDSLIEYPSAFPIKVMGLKVEGFAEAMVALAREHDPGYDVGHAGAARERRRQVPGAHTHDHRHQPRAA